MVATICGAMHVSMRNLWVLMFTFPIFIATAMTVGLTRIGLMMSGMTGIVFYSSAI